MRMVKVLLTDPSDYHQGTRLGELRDMQSAYGADVILLKAMGEVVVLKDRTGNWPYANR
jgi:hypothetical protein